MPAYSSEITSTTFVGEVSYHKGKALNALGQATEADAAFAKAKELGYSG
jgi:hypothetical protein